MYHLTLISLCGYVVLIYGLFLSLRNVWLTTTQVSVEEAERRAAEADSMAGGAGARARAAEGGDAYVSKTKQ